MSPCHNLEPSLVARDSSRLLSVKPNEWMHLSPFYTRMHGEWLRYAKSTSQFHWRFLLVRDVRGFQVNPLCRHDITSPFPPSGVGNETLRPLGVATGNALSVTRSEDTYEKTPPVGRRQPMTSLPACHNISAAGRKHHQLLRLKLASEAWLEAQGTQCLVPHSGNHGYIRNLRRSPSWELELRPLGVATGNVIPTSPC